MGHAAAYSGDAGLGFDGMDAVMRGALRWISLLASMGAVVGVQGQQEDWTLDVRLLTSLPLGRPSLGDGTGWRGQPLRVIQSPLMARWGQQGTRSYGVSVRRRLGDVGQLAFGFEQTRRIWTVEADWMPAVNSAPLSTVTMDWIVASYSMPILYRTEVTLAPGWRLGAGGGLVMEILPTNAFSAQSNESSGNVFALEHNSLRYNWNRWGMGLELGIVREGEDADLHIGGALRPLIQPLFQGELTARWNVGQPDAALREVDRTLDGSWWALDVRLILH